MPLPAASDSSSPGESESEDSRTSGSGAEDSGGGLTVDSDDSDPPDMRGMSLLSWGSYAGCLDWCMSIGVSQRRLGFNEGLTTPPPPHACLQRLRREAVSLLRREAVSLSGREAVSLSGREAVTSSVDSHAVSRLFSA
jgi:hypothetical protein